MMADQMANSPDDQISLAASGAGDHLHGTGSVCNRFVLGRGSFPCRLMTEVIFHSSFCNASFNKAMPLRIRARDSSLPRTSIISVAPAGVICLPDTAVLTGHIA